MGGLAIDSSKFLFEQPLIYLTTAGALRLNKLSYELPDISRDTIVDKSKADSLGKILVALQAGYMVVQVVGRLIAHLPVTLIEVNTLGHVLCALTMYMFWLHKPLGVCDPIQLSEDWAEPMMVLWYMKDRDKNSFHDMTSSINHTNEYKELEILPALRRSGESRSKRVSIHEGDACCRSVSSSTTTRHWRLRSLTNHGTHTSLLGRRGFTTWLDQI